MNLFLLIFLVQDMKKDEVFQDNAILKRKLSELWIKVKASN